MLGGRRHFDDASPPIHSLRRARHLGQLRHDPASVQITRVYKQRLARAKRGIGEIAASDELFGKAYRASFFELPIELATQERQRQRAGDKESGDWNDKFSIHANILIDIC